MGNAPGIGTLRFINSTYNFYLDENSGRGTYVGAVQARFVRGGPSAISYSFASGNEDDTFRIEPSVGQCTTPLSVSSHCQENIATFGDLYHLGRSTTQ